MILPENIHVLCCMLDKLHTRVVSLETPGRWRLPWKKIERKGSRTIEPSVGGQNMPGVKYASETDFLLDLPIESRYRAAENMLFDVFQEGSSNWEQLHKFMQYIHNISSEMLNIKGEKPNRKTYIHNTQIWPPTFFSEDNKYYLAMFAGLAVQEKNSTNNNMYSIPIQLNNSKNWLDIEHTKPYPDGWLLDCNIDAPEYSSEYERMQLKANSLGNAHLFQHRCINYNCEIDAIQFKNSTGKISKLPVIVWKDNSMAPKEGEELTLNYGSTYVKPLADWQTLGYAKKELKKCQCADCQKSRNPNFMPMNAS